MSVIVQVRCDKAGCTEVYEVEAFTGKNAMAEARDAGGWEVNFGVTDMGKAKCPRHRGSSGARLKPLGAGAL
jgi:hypothetical protein